MLALPGSFCASVTSSWTLQVFLSLQKPLNSACACMCEVHTLSDCCCCGHRRSLAVIPVACLRSGEASRTCFRPRPVRIEKDGSKKAKKQKERKWHLRGRVKWILLIYRQTVRFLRWYRGKNKKYINR